MNRDLALAETCIGLLESLPSETFDKLYDKYKDAVGGFTGLRTVMAEWALTFFECEPDCGESFEYVDALSDYANVVAKLSLDEKLVDLRQAERLAKHIISKHSY